MAIAIMTSGGDCAGMNPAIKKFVKYCLEIGETPYLIYDGLEGMIDNDIRPCSHETVAGIMHLGGTIIRSSRSKRFFDHTYRKQAYENLNALNIDKLVVLGGDGSFRALDVFYKEFNVSFAGIPATIDNDIFGTEYCLGVDTALNIIRDAIDNLRDTASSFKRAFVVEIMGRDCGYLALVSAVTNGAEVMIIPEVEYNLDSMKKRLQDEIKNGRRYIIAMVSEGAKATTKVRDWLKDEVGMECRVTILGHIQRGGNPTVFDRLMAYEFMTKALDGLFKENIHNSIVVYNNSKMDYVSIDYINSQKHRVKEELVNISKHLSV